MLGLGSLCWTDLCNRNERLEQGSLPQARVCTWHEATFLTVARVFPRVGSRLLRYLIRNFPFNDEVVPASAKAQSSDISVILPVGGADRTALFSATLASFLRQRRAAIEIIVVESGEKPLFKHLCPESVKYCFVQRDANEDFNKSQLMNIGATEATSPVLLLHDADIVVPVHYVEQALEIIAQGWEAVRPIRLLFCLDQPASSSFISDNSSMPAEVSDVMQNFPGASTVVLSDSYWAIGGHDEQFRGWGGEDVDFLQRLQTRKLFQGAYAPAIHLWHPFSPKKQSEDKNKALLTQVKAQPVQERIDQLCSKQDAVL